MPYGQEQGMIGGAASGAASGAAVGGPWGAVAGGVIGGLSGALGGSAADERRRKEKLAQQRLNRALRLYGRRTEQVSDETVGQARSIDDQYRAALQAHLAGQPDLAAQLPGRVGAAQAQFQGAAAPALQPMVGGQTGGENAYLQRVMADTQRRFSDAANPLAAQAGAAQSAMSDEEYRRQLATQLMGFQPQIRNLGQLQALQQAQDFETLSGAKNRYGAARQRAATAGSGQLLQSQLLQAGGAGLAGAFMGQRQGTPNLFPGAATITPGMQAQLNAQAAIPRFNY